MPYDPEMDKTLKKWKCEETGLVVSINQYGTGEPKVQIGPRILLKKDGTERAPAKAGRLTIEDIFNSASAESVFPTTAGEQSIWLKAEG